MLTISQVLHLFRRIEIAEIIDMLAILCVTAAILTAAYCVVIVTMLPEKVVHDRDDDAQ